MENHTLAIGNHVRVSETYWDASFRGATGVITEPSDHICNHVQPGTLWVEFDELILADNAAHPIEAAAVEMSGLELIP